MKISIVIPNYNGEELLKRNLPRVIGEITKLRNKEIEIILIDDGSNDNSVEYVKDLRLKRRIVSETKILKIKLIENDKNLGFSSTVNRGVKEARGEIVILMNTDIYPEGNFIEPFLTHFKNPHIFAVGMMDKSKEESNIVRRGRGIAWWEKGFLLHRRGEVNKSDTFWVSGGSSAFRKSIWEKLDGFDELFNPFYWEDIDLSYRAKKAGYEVIFEPKSIVIHEHLEGSIKKQFSDFQVKTIAYRNQFFFVWKNITDKKLLLSHLVWLPIHLFLQLISLDFSFHLGFIQALIKLPVVILKRNKNKKVFKIQDQDLILSSK